MWEYLESLGILEKGTDEEIKMAKKAYRKKYLANYKKEQRLSKPEFTINFSNENGEYDRVEHASKNHKMPITGFIRQATMAYISKTYVVPDKMGIAHIEQMLAGCLNEIQTIVRQKERYHFDREQKFEAIEKRIERLEEEIERFIKRPLPIEEFVKRAVIKDPTLKEQILAILNLSHDNKNLISPDTKL